MTQRQNTWFKRFHAYEGRAQITFCSPSGTISGPAKAVFDEQGRAEVTLQVGEFSCQERSSFGPIALLWGTAHSTDEVQTISFGGGERTAVKCVIETEEGVLRSVGKVLVDLCGSLPFEALFGALTGRTLSITALHWVFDPSESRASAFWCMPLINFVGKCCQRPGMLDRHPLRVQPVAAASNMLNWGPDSDRVIEFTLAGKPAFIQHAPDAEAKLASLRSNRCSHAVTAIAIGDAGAVATDWPQLNQWFPVNWLRILSLATSVEVGAPCIEFRAADGSLTRRLHIQMGARPFHEGRCAVDELIDGGIGKLLTAALASPVFKVGKFQVAIQSLIDVAISSTSIELEFYLLARAFDALFAACKPSPTSEISAQTRERVNTLISDLLKPVAGAEKSATNDEVKGEIRRLRHTLERASHPNPTFEEKITRVLAHFRFSDGLVVGRYLDPGMPSLDLHEWLKQIAKIRNRVVHGEVIDYEEMSIESAYKLRLHLYDLTLRTLLKAVGYTGQYQAATVVGHNSVALDWVTPTTPPSWLGYK